MTVLNRFSVPLSIKPQAQAEFFDISFILSRCIRKHWCVENRLHWCMEVTFGDDQMRTRIGIAAHNLALLKHISLNLIRLDPGKRKVGNQSQDDSSPPLAMTTAHNSSDSSDVHAIALALADTAA
jgi:hypothetical protein